MSIVLFTGPHKLVTKVAQKFSATSFDLLVLNHGRIVNREVSISRAPIGFSFVILQNHRGTLTKQNSMGTWMFGLVTLVWRAKYFCVCI